MNFLRTLLDGEPAWFIAILRLSLQAAILAAIVFTALKLVGRWIPPAWRALLWFVVILRVLIPFSPPSPFSFQNLYAKPPPIAAVPIAPVGRTYTLDLPVDLPIIDAVPGRVEPVKIEQQRKSKILMSIWSLGVAFGLMGLLVRYAMIRRHLAMKSPSSDVRLAEELAECRLKFRMRYPVRVALSDRIAAPALTGLFQARLIIPTDFAERNLTEAQVRHVLMHELAHLRLGHLFLHWLALISRALHWFNPVIHFAAARLREECELAADAAALRGATETERCAYGETILKVLSQTVAPSSRLALGMAEQARHLEKRLRAVAAPPRRSFGLIGIIALACLLVSGLSGAERDVAPPIDKPTAQDINAAEQSGSITDELRINSRNTLGNSFSATIDNSTQAQANLATAESKFRANPDDLNAGFNLTSAYLELARTNDAFKVLQQMLDRPNVSKETILSVANVFSQLGDMHGLESSLAKLVKALPDSAEAWYDYSRAQSVLKKVPEAILSLSNAIQLSEARLATNPITKNLKRQALTDVSFGGLRKTQEFQKLTGSIQDQMVTIERAWNELPHRGSNQPFGNPFARTNTAATSTYRQALFRKLETIRIDDFPLEKETDLLDVLKELGSEIKKRDPGGRGVNLLIAQAAARPLQTKDAIDALTGLPGAVTINPEVDVEKFKIKFDPPIRDLTLRKFLDAIVAVAKPPPGAPSAARLQYSIEDYAVVFSQQSHETEQFRTRTYKIDTTNASFPNGVRAFLLKAAGVDFPTNQIGQPGNPPQSTPTKAMYYNETAGILFVRSTLADLDKIEQAIHTLNLQPAQISFEVTLVEMLGPGPFDSLPNLPAPRQIVITNEYVYPLPLDSAGHQPVVAIEAAKSLDVPVRTSVHTVNASEYFIPNAQAKQIKGSLLNKPGVNILSAPTVTTLITRPARISVEETRFVVTDRTVVKDGKIVSGAANVSAGPSVSVYPESANSDEIKTKVTYTFTEFLGTAPDVIQVRETTSNIQIPHHHTQIIIIPPQPGTGVERDARQHIIFLTPTIIDSRGMPVFK